MAKKNTVAKLGYEVVSFSEAGPHSINENQGNDLLKLLASGPATGPPLLTVQEVAAILRCSVSSLNKWRLRGVGPRFIRVGARVRYRIADLTAYVTNQTRISTSATGAPQVTASSMTNSSDSSPLTLENSGDE